MTIDITPHRLVGLRRQHRLLFTSSVEVWRRTYAPSATGGRTATLTRDSVGPGKIGPVDIANTEITSGDRQAVSAGWVITLPHDRDVREQDQLRIGTRQFEVSGVGPDRSWPLIMRVAVREVPYG